MAELARQVLESDLLVLATPIYSWYCTPPMKAALDRLVYGMNKYYGERRGPSLWAGKRLALITTCGYRPGGEPDPLGGRNAALLQAFRASLSGDACRAASRLQYSLF